MTTDPFTTAARAEAVRWWQTPSASPGNVIEKLGQHMAEWARARLAAQEPTDAEVQEAAIALLAFIHNEPAERIREVYGVLDRDGHWSTQARAALSGARAARRDEEER